MMQHRSDKVAELHNRWLPHRPLCWSVLIKMFGVLAAFYGTAVLAQSVQKKSLTVSDSIVTRRILKPIYGDSNGLTYSPNGKRYLLLLTQADIKRNGNWIEFVSGLLDTRQSAKPLRIIRLFTSSTRSSPFLLSPIRWLDDEDRIAFLWDDGEKPMYVMSLNLRTGELKALVQASTEVSGFSASADGKSIIYAATVVPRDWKPKLPADGFVVAKSVDLYNVLQGNLSGDPLYRKHVFTIPSTGKVPVKVSASGGGTANGEFLGQVALSMSPDGRYAVATAVPHVVPASWSGYDDSYLVSKIEAHRRSPDDPSSFVQDLSGRCDPCQV